MPKTKDILSKVWLRRGTDGMLSRRLCGGRIVEHLATEQPRISNRQADILVRNDQGVIQHVEFQASNEPEFPFRMLEYWVFFRREYGQGVKQCVFYIGGEPIRFPARFAEGDTLHRFEIVNLQEYDAADLLASEDWGDNLWSLGAIGESSVVMKEILLKLSAMNREERELALAELTAYSGILKLDDLLNQKLKESPMVTIDLKNNAVIRPLLVEAEQQGRQDLLLSLLAEKFGSLPSWAADRIYSASPEQLDQWARRFVRASSLEDTFN